MDRLSFQHSIDKIVIQPTTQCNLNCSYCYLEGRDKRQLIPLETCRQVADYLRGASAEVTVIWHGGEPMAAGISYFRELLEEFRGLTNVRHALQTNGTLINDQWCQVFSEYRIEVGISLDGDQLMNRQRVDWGGHPTFDKTLRGIAALKRNNIRFHCIAVATDQTLDRVDALYEFFCQLGCWSLGINIEEAEGANAAATGLNKERVVDFWAQLFALWKDKPAIRIREFDHALSWLYYTGAGYAQAARKQIDLLPTVTTAGDVIFLSPELVASPVKGAYDFRSGNLAQRPLHDIIGEFMRSALLEDFKEGISQCHRSCPYFSFCGGGHASNKFYENGSLRSTETTYCRNAKQGLVDALINEL